MDWKATAEKKRASVIAAIPRKWIVPSPPSIQDQRDVTGTYIQQYLSPQEIEITESAATAIVEKASSGQWKAVEIAEAFCHRAAIAHQLVS